MAIEDVPLADRKRMAICYMKSTQQQAVDWANAAQEYDPKVKKESFKTVTLRNLKSIGNGDVTENDLNRLALCYAYSTDKQAVDWAGAADKYDSKVKVASFKTVTMRAMKKHGYNTTVTSSPAKTSVTKKPAAKKGAKRKAEVEETAKNSRRKINSDEDSEAEEPIPEEGADDDDDTIKAKDVSDSEDEDEDARIQREIAEHENPF